MLSSVQFGEVAMESYAVKESDVARGSYSANEGEVAMVEVVAGRILLRRFVN